MKTQNPCHASKWMNPLFPCCFTWTMDPSQEKMGNISPRVISTKDCKKKSWVMSLFMSFQQNGLMCLKFGDEENSRWLFWLKPCAGKGTNSWCPNPMSSPMKKMEKQWNPWKKYSWIFRKIKWALLPKNFRAEEAAWRISKIMAMDVFPWNFPSPPVVWSDFGANSWQILEALELWINCLTDSHPGLVVSPNEIRAH